MQAGRSYDGVRPCLHPSYLASLLSAKRTSKAIMDESYGKSDDAAYLSLPVLRVMPPNESGIARPTAVSNRNSNSSKVLGSGNTINNDNSVINHLNILHGDVPNESVRLLDDLLGGIH